MTASTCPGARSTARSRTATRPRRLSGPRTWAAAPTPPCWPGWNRRWANWRGAPRAGREQARGELAAALRASGEPGTDDALEDLDRVHEELGRRKPDRGRLAQLMDRVTAVITPAGGLLELAHPRRGPPP